MKFQVMLRTYKIGLEAALGGEFDAATGKRAGLGIIERVEGGKEAPDCIRFEGTLYQGPCLADGWKFVRSDGAKGLVYLVKQLPALQFGKADEDGGMPETPKGLDNDDFAELMNDLAEQATPFSNEERAAIADAINNGLYLLGNKQKPKPPSSKGEAARLQAELDAIESRFAASPDADWPSYGKAVATKTKAVFLRTWSTSHPA